MLRNPEAEKVPEVTDYLAHANENGIAIRLKTYGGLVKMASKWHEDINYERVREDWQEKRSRYSAQSSLADPTSTGD